MNTKPKSQPQAAEWWSSLDAQWQAIFRKAIGINSEPTADELVTILSLTQLECDFRGLTSLEPLRALTGLQTLNCIGNELTNLEPLRACLGLQSLECDNNQLTSLEGLQACPDLQTLYCGFNQLTSLEPLRACPGLQTLNCIGNQLISLEPLQACLGLQTLECDNNQLTSLEPLFDLKKLKTLECRRNPSLSQSEIERFQKAVPSGQEVNGVSSGLNRPSPVDKLTNAHHRRRWWSSLDKQWQAIFKATIGIKNEPMADELVKILSLTQLDCSSRGLTELDCSSRELTSLEPLRACTGLQKLNCERNHLTSLEGLQGVTGLRTLDCIGNQLTSLEPLQGCTGLQTLNCDGNQLTSLEPLRALTSLQSLHCSNNQLTSLGPLQGCTGLQTLNCSHNYPLTSLEGLQGCTGLQTLDCQHNQLTSLEPLRACTGLQSLYCRENQLTSLEGLQACTGLQTLYCWENRLTSLEPLHGLKSLKKLEWGGNPSLSQPELERFLTKNRWCWWSSLDAQWQTIFREAIGIESEPTEDELVAILSLTQLDCSGRYLTLTSLKPLRACRGLQKLYCNKSRLTSLEGLQACTGLQTLNCGGNHLTSLEGLQGCTGLRALCCRNNELTNLEGLQGCTGLQKLYCEENRLTSLEGLYGLKTLKKLDCRYNPSLSSQKIERFEKAVPSCEVSPTAENQRQIERNKIERNKIEVAELREQARLKDQKVAAELGIDKIVPANNHFGFRLFVQLLRQDLGKNVFMSPPSIAIALAMTYNGAAGKTKKAMAKTLGLENLSLEEVNQANLALRNVLLHQPNVSLLIANSLWLNQDFHLEPAFLMRTQQYYAANITNADFQDSHTVPNINQWVKENTQGKIGPVVQHLDPLTVLLVINAIYFKGTWAEPFHEANTRKRDFTLLTGENKRMPMMSQYDKYRYYQDSTYQAVCLPYKASSLSMTIFLPDRGTRLSNFPLRYHWQEWRAGNTSREGTLVLPRFKVEYQVTLNEAIKALGMTEAFSVKQADFSKMAKVPKGWNIFRRKYLYISQVKHQTFVEVNEGGTEAAAFTITRRVANSIPPFKMIVDHPFLFTIQDDGTGTVLFLGAIVEPK